MTKFLLASLFVFGASAQASHRTGCDVDAKVTNITQIPRLDGTVVFSRQQTLVASDHEEILEAKVNSVSNQTGTTDCSYKVADTISLIVEKSKINTYKKDQSLRLEYQNFGDRAASRITWSFRK